MSSPTGLLYHQQAHSSSFMVLENPNPRDVHSINGGVHSILSSNIESAPDLHFLAVQQLPGAPTPSPPIPLPRPSPLSQKHCPPSALEEANVDGALRLPPRSSHSVISASAPTPNTMMSSLDNLDTFVHALNQELHRSPNASIICSVRRNDEPVNALDGPLEQRLEKKMNVQLSIIAPAANQRIKLPVPTATFTSGVSEPKPLFLSLVIAGETTRRIFGGVGLYHQNQPKSGLVNIIEGSNFSPVVCIRSGRTVCIGFKFTTYPRQCDPSEDAFRVMVTIHDCDGRLVAYSLSTSAYSVKSHPRNIKRSLQASIDDSEDAGNSRPKRRRANSAVATTPTSSTARNHALPSDSSAAGGSSQQQSGGSANIGGPPIVEPAVDRSGGTPILIVDPRVSSLLQEPRTLSSFNPIEAPQPMPTLDEAVPASCSWRGGVAISLFVNNLPQDGPIYARFGHIVVKTDRKTPHVLGCKVPAAPGPCEVDVTLSKGSGPDDEMYGRSLCKFTYEEDDITRMIRSLKAEAQGPLWNAVQEYASRNRLVPSPSYAYQSIYDQSTMGPWPVASYASLEVVEDEIEMDDDVVQPETSNSVPDLEVTSHSPSVLEDECSDATGTEMGESTEGARGQDTTTLDMVPLDAMEDASLRTIPKPSVSPILKPTEPIIQDYILNSPPSVMQYSQPARPNPFDQELFGNAMTGQQPLEIAPSAPPPPPNRQTHTSRTGVWNPSITAQIRPPGANVAYEPPPTSAITSTPGSNVEDSAHERREVRQSIDLSHFYNDAVHRSHLNIRLECHLKDPKGYQQNSKIVVRREKRVVLEMQLQADCERMGWKGIALPRTGSVKPPNQQAPTGLLYFSIEVHGSTTGMSLTQPCDNCRRREMQFPGNPHGLPHYLIDFKSDSPFILFPRVDTLPYAKAEVTFHFTCYSNHQKEDYKLVATLCDEEGNLVAFYQLPYSFNCTAFRHTVGDPQDKCTSIVHTPVLSPATTGVTFESGSSSASYCTSSSRSTTSSFSLLTTPPGDQDRTSIRYPAPPILHPSRCEAIDCRPTSFGVGPRKDIQQPEAVGQPLLQRVVPSEGPTHGGPKIVLIGTNFPPWPTIVYAKFGSAATVTSWINPYTLECTLPPSHTGIVNVTLSHSLDHEAPMLGRSLCTFTYREEREPFLLMLRSIYSQGHELSRVSLDTLIPQILQHESPETLNHVLRRLGQSRESLPPIHDRELEELGAHFLAIISDSPQWSNDLSFADQNQQTIAHLCVFFGYTRLLKKIVDWGIDLDVRDVNGLTALHCAYLRKDRECVRILKEAGANEYIKDNLGRIPRGMCQYVDTEGTIHSEKEEPSTPARFSSAGEEDWVHVASWTSPSPDNFTPFGTQPRLQRPWRSPSIFKAADGGIRASSIPIPRPSSEGSPIADDESWSAAFSNLQITDSLLPAPSFVTSSLSRHGGGAPQVSQYGWSHRSYLKSPPRLQRNVLHEASARYGSLPTTSSFNSLQTFPMPQPAVESQGMVHSERVAGRFSSAGELNALKMFTSSENSPLLGAQMMPPLDWRNSSDIATSCGIRASPMPMPEPSTEDSNEDSCIQELGDLHISESPQPMAMSFSSLIGSPSSRGDGPPRYGWSHRICPQSPMGVQLNVPSGAPVIFHSLQATSSFDSPAPAFPIPEPALLFPMPEPTVPFPVPESASHPHHLEPVPLSFLSAQPAISSFPVSGQAVPSLQLHHFDQVEASFTIPQPSLPSFAVPALTLPVHEPPVPSYPVPEPTGYLEQTNEYVNSLRLSPAPQHSPPRMAPYPVSTHHFPAQSPHFHAPHATYTNPLHIFTGPPSSQSTQQMHQPPSSPRFDPSPSPPPPQYGSSDGVVPNSPPHNSGLEEEAAARRHRFQETMRTIWLSAGQEKTLESRIGQTTVALGSGSDTFADAGEESIQ